MVQAQAEKYQYQLFVHLVHILTIILQEAERGYYSDWAISLSITAICLLFKSRSRCASSE